MKHNRTRFAEVRRSTRRGNARETRVCLIIVALCSLETAAAQTEIHKCTDADGGIVYSQLPCKPQKSVKSERTEPDSKTENESPESAGEELRFTEIPQEEPESYANSSVCKKMVRNEIDAIDAEIGREYSPEKAEQYKQRLLVLTRKLRQC